MTPRERVIAVLNRQHVDIIPSLGEVPMDITCLKKTFPGLTGDEVSDQIQIAEFFDNSGVDLDMELPKQTLYKDEKEYVYEYPTGARWRESYEPVFCREAVKYPVNTPEEAFSFSMPVYSADRVKLKEKISYLKSRGYFVQGHVIGGWASMYYYVASFENSLMWMLTDPEAVHHLMKEITEYSLESAKCLLECGVDSIMTISDLGSADRLLFSRELFLEFVFPWLRKLADLCHSYGKYLHFHSHGHIEDLAEDLVRAGVDILNPVGPSDNNSLEMFKERWGNKITLLGGISTTISSMSEEEMKKHVMQVVEVGRKDGAYFPRTESGIPPMPEEKILKYIEILKEARQMGYSYQD